MNLKVLKEFKLITFSAFFLLKVSQAHLSFLKWNISGGFAPFACDAFQDKACAIDGLQIRKVKANSYVKTEDGKDVKISLT